MAKALPIFTAAGSLVLATALGAQTTASAPPESYAQCAGCHGQKLEGGSFGPALRGQAFVAKWKGKLPDLAQLVSTRMPIAAPGSLSSAEYDALNRYIVTINPALGPVGQQAAAAGGAPDAPTPGPGDVPAVHGSGIKTEGVLKLGLGPQGAAPEIFRDDAYRRAEAAKQKTLAGLTVVTAETLRSPPDGDWLMWRRTLDGRGFSPLSQVNRDNVAKLSVKWSWSLPAGTNQLAPIIHDGVMFVQSAREVQAIDAATGEMLWRFQREVPALFRGPVNGTQRNFAIFGDKIFVATADRHLVALDFRTGRQIWDFEVVGAANPGILTSSGPFMAGNVLMQGVSMGPGCTRGCFVLGLDPDSGKQLWKFDTVAKPGEPGGDTWNGTALEDRSGAAVWIAGTYDPELGIAYFGTGGTYGISRLLTAGKNGKPGKNDALYTDSTIALDPKTGKLIWAHQHFPREIWDLDEVFERTLVDLPIKGVPRKLVVTIGKVGILDVLDRVTGQYVSSKDFGLNTIVSAINPVTGARTINPDKVLKPNVATDICPSPEGARNWMATAYNAQSRLLFVPMQETCATISWVVGDEASPAKGRLDIGWSLKPAPNSDGKYGRLEAVDLVTGKTVWVRRDRHIPASSLLATAGGLLFTGNADRWFRALDQASGTPLWEVRLNAVPNATPVTYTVGGKQFVAVATGGGGPHDADTIELTPETERASPSTTIWVFGLPDN